MYTNKMIYVYCTIRRYTCAVVCFVGDEKVSVASVTVDHASFTPEASLRAKLHLLRRNVPDPASSERPVRAQFAFIVAWNASWRHSGVVSAFAELFPGVPLSGYFTGCYKFGHEVLPVTEPRVSTDGTRAARRTDNKPDRVGSAALSSQ